jgi:hypothetical protein
MLNHFFIHRLFSPSAAQPSLKSAALELKFGSRFSGADFALFDGDRERRDLFGSFLGDGGDGCVKVS